MGVLRVVFQFNGRVKAHIENHESHDGKKAKHARAPETGSKKGRLEVGQASLHP